MSERVGGNDRHKIGTHFALFLVFLVHSVYVGGAVATSTGLRSQFEVDCPRGCRCSRTNVECVDTKLHGSDWFSTVRPEAYPDLDTIVATGNLMDNLAGTSLFGTNVTNRFVSLANLSGNAITAFDAYTFRGLPALEYLYLYDNSVERIGPSPFRWNQRLRVLDVSRFFAQTVSLNDRPKLIKKLFINSDNRLADLQELIIRDNSLIKLDLDTFCGLNGLIRLHLSGNKLTEFITQTDCLQNLNLLDLSGNEITTVPATLWKDLPSLITTDISLNPLICDCRLADAIEWLSKSSSSALNQGRTICALPKQRTGHNVFEIDNLDCNTSSHHYTLYLALIVLCFCIMFIFIRTYRARIKFINSLPLIAGYSKLDEEQHTGPQFV